MIGIIDIRHELNDFLASYGGHIGLGIRPSERRKGYAALILANALDYCNEIGLKKVMLSCYKDNPASRNTILKCGGRLEKEFPLSDLENCLVIEDNSDEKIVQIFWINL